MDYEKKYKEALGWMQSVYPTMTGAVKEDAEHYFPELKSEDERIREAIIDEFKGEFDAICDRITPEYDETDEVDKRRMETLREYLAWLEKQGEHKVEPTNITDQLKEEYQKGWDAAMQQLPQEADNQVWQIVSDTTMERSQE